jgi:hypothetical protein
MDWFLEHSVLLDVAFIALVLGVLAYRKWFGHGAKKVAGQDHDGTS